LNRTPWGRKPPEPFYRSPGPTEGRRLLLISIHFPPSQAAGALRWQKLAGHAAERGWGLDVVTLPPSSLGSSDPRRLEELPPGTRVYGVPSRGHWLDRAGGLVTGAIRSVRSVRPGRRGPGGDAGAANGDGASAVRASVGRSEATLRLSSPGDLRRAVHAWIDYATYGRWAREAARLALGLVVPGQHQAVITCGPPHMAHRAGARVQRATGLPFIMDMRDPWSLVQRLPAAIGSPLWWRLAERHERAVLGRASLVVVNTEPLKVAMQQAHPQASDRVLAVLNGYDEEPLPPPRPGSRFVAAYAGTIYLDRDPRPLFRAAGSVVRELELTPEEFGIELMGTVQLLDGVWVDYLAGTPPLPGFVRTHPPGSRSEALEFLAGARMLVSLPQDSDLAIPSKVFEYMQYRAWVLALAEPGSATGQVLDGSGADVVSATDEAGLTRALRTRLLQHRAGERPTGLSGVDRYSRREQAKILFDRLEVIAR
jgi:hypothetical protein